MTDIVFTISDIYGNALEFVSDLLWTFELTPLPDEDLSKIPGLFTPEQRGETEQQEGEQQEQQEGEQQEQQEQQTQEGQQEEEQQNELPQQIQPVSGDEQTGQEEIIIPQPDGLMRRGLRAIELIGPQPKEDSIMKNGIENVKLVE